MKKMARNIAAVALVGVFAITAVACGGGNETTTAPAGTTAAAIEIPPMFQYPMDTDVVLTYWAPAQTNHSGIVGNIGETRIKQNLMAATGIEVEFIQPVGGTSQEAFDILMATAQFPDIIQANWHGGFTGGPMAAIMEGVIIPLNQPMSQWAPNFLTVMNQNPDVRLQVMTDNGDYYVFPFLRLDEILRTSTGPMLRADWLNQLNLDVPETIEDWENVLIAFRDNFDANFTGVHSGGNPNGMHAAFAGAWGLRPTQSQGFNIRYGTQEVFWSFNEPTFRDYMETMIRWYDMGLLDPD